MVDLVTSALLNSTWEGQLNENPFNWNLRYQYATFLEEADLLEHCIAQRWMADNEKCPGPPCVQEAHEGEATWFSEENRVGQSWSFPHFVNHNKVDRHWCLPLDIFKRLDGYIVGRRDGGSHNKWAKSWNSRFEAEEALVWALMKRKSQFRSIDDKWTPSGW